MYDILEFVNVVIEISCFIQKSTMHYELLIPNISFYMILQSPMDYIRLIHYITRLCKWNAFKTEYDGIMLYRIVL